MCRSFPFDPSMVYPCTRSPASHANDDNYSYATAVSCTTPFFLDVTSNDVNVYVPSLVVSTSPTSGTAAVTSTPSTGINFTPPCNNPGNTFRGYISFQYIVCGLGSVPVSNTATVTFAAGIVPPSGSPFSILPARSTSMTVDLSMYFTAGTYTIDWSTLTGASSIPTGAISYSSHYLTFTPSNSRPVTASFMVQVCDNPALPPANVSPPGPGIRCANVTVTVNPTTDSDGDGVPDVHDIDCDNDGILNTIEAPGLLDPIGDANSDGIINAADPSNPSCGGVGRFGWCNNYDLDQDGVANFLDLDSDADTIPDEIEGLSTSFLGGAAGVASLDSDANGMLDGPFSTNGLDSRVQSPANSGTPNSMFFGSPNYPDTDSDGARDFLDLDSDADGVPDMWESRGLSLVQWAAIDSDFNHVVDTGPDADQDGFEDSVDKTPSVYGSAGIATKLSFADPSTSVQGSGLDRDKDGVPDFRDLDSDNDGVLDAQECALQMLGGALVSSTYDVVAPFGVIDAEKAGMPDADKDGIPSGIDSNDSVFGTVFKNLAVSGARRELGDTDGDGIPDMYDLDSDNDGVSDLIESGNAAAIAGDTIPAGGDGVIDGPDTDGDGIKDAADGSINSYGSATRNTPRDSNNDGIPDMLQLYSLAPANGLSDLLRSGRDVSKYDTNNNGIVDGTTDNDYDGIIDTTPAPGLYALDFEPGFFGGLKPPGPQTPTPVINIILPDFHPTTIDVTNLFVAFMYPLDTSTLTSTQPPPSAGTVTVPGYPNVVFTPTPGNGSPSTFTISLCSATIGTCSVVIVNVQPYYLRWASPTANANWYMYFPQV